MQIDQDMGLARAEARARALAANRRQSPVLQGISDVGGFFTLAGHLASSAFAAEAGVLPGFWRGQNGKWNRVGWGGNGATGGRTEVLFNA